MDIETSQMAARRYEQEQGSCDDSSEDLVKSFLPSLFDSDSDTEDAYYMPSAVGDPHSQRELPQILINFQTTSHGSCGFTSDPPEASSPSSQGNSSFSAFHSSTLAEASGSLDSPAAFQSVLSIASSTSVSDSCIEDERQSKNSKVDGTRPARDCLPNAKASPNSSSAKHTDQVSSSASGQIHLAAARTCCKRGRQEISPGPSAAPLAAAKKAYHGGGSRHAAATIATGTPVSCSSPALTAPLISTAPAAALPNARSWTPFQYPQCSAAFPATPGPWPAPPGMIPTAPLTAFYPQRCPAPSQLQRLPSPANTPEKISAALAELGDASMVKPPLGLKLDKVSVMQQLRGIGMAVVNH